MQAQRSTEDVSDQLAELERQSEAPTWTWVPDPEGDPKDSWLVTPTVSGVVASITPYANDTTGNEYRVYALVAKDGATILVHASRTVLANELESVAVGDMVAITFLGEVTREGRKPYFSYKVACRAGAKPAEPETHVSTTIEATTVAQPLIGRTPGPAVSEEPPPLGDADDPSSWGANEEAS
jgi:hypothetical protein